MKFNVRKDDKVAVIAGKDKGKQGRVLSVNPSSQRVLVERVNIAKKALRPKNEQQQGGIIEIEAPLHVSNVMLICPSCNKPTRTGNKRSKEGKRIRVCKKCGKDID
ncbi:MAG: 50S ribosomal protein L24 [Coriobacteriia bacterium]|nr:50S ribosomal protein L24 [Coriobacteriia bacterium]